MCIDGLIEGKTIDKALKEAIDELGKDDGQESAAAYPILVGNSSRLNTEIANGGFELDSVPLY